MRRNDDFLPARREREQFLSPWRQGDWPGSSFFSGSPWQMMRRMQEDMDRVFSQFFGSQDLPAVPEQFRGQAGLQSWAPSVDVSQTDREWCIEVDLPGVKKDDIEAPF